MVLVTKLQWVYYFTHMFLVLISTARDHVIVMLMCSTSHSHSSCVVVVVLKVVGIMGMVFIMLTF